MLDTFLQFHFLRPDWLWGLLLLPAFWLARHLRSQRKTDWSKAIDEQLLSVLTPSKAKEKRKQQDGLLICALALAILGMSGPTWQQKPQPVQQISDDMVVILDLSLSMLATDNSPNRLTRVKQKLQDLLNLRTEGNTALIAFSGDSHVVTPLTDDIKTIQANLPALDPFMMPVIGSRPDLAITQAISLFQQAGSTHGRIILLTDGVEPHQIERINEQLSDTSLQLHVLAAGTKNGAPIDLPDRGYLKDGDQVVIPKTDFNALNQLASANNGMMVAITLTDDDLKRLDISGSQLVQTLKQDNPIQNALFDSWEDMGYLFLIAIIPLVLVAYRQGILIIAVILFLPSEESFAFGWDDLWRTPDQQAQMLLEQGQADKAATLFESPQHKAYAQYQSGNYSEAEKAYQAEADITASYNLANTLAKQQQFEAALAAYDRVLQQEPGHEDARFNKQIIEQILQAQQSQSDQQSQDQQNQDQQNSQDNNSDNSENQEDKQNSSQQNQQNQEQGNNNSEQNQGSQEQENQQQNNADASTRNEDDKSQNEQDPNTDKESQSKQDSIDKQQAEEQKQAEEQAMAESMPNELSEEEKQSFEQWMRRVPDDPAGLLRRKFEQQARERNRTSREQGEPLW